jgi:Uma2 family endonuclease
MMATTKLTTAEDLLLMSEDEGRFELIEGELREMPPTGEEHGELAAILTSHLLVHSRKHQLGTVYAAETGFFISRSPDVVLAPDVAFVRAGRLAADRDRRKFVEVAPDLVVEVVSPSEEAGDVTNKVQRYLNAGVQLVWVVYPAQQTVAVFRADRTWTTLHTSDTLDGADVLPGFKLNLSELFTGDA